MMAHVIAAPCVADYSCVDICPVGCISPRPAGKDFNDAEQLYIDPDVCVDCGACIEICPVPAIFEAGCLPDKWRHYARVNRDYFLAGGESS
jgi:ferredoxin